MSAYASDYERRTDALLTTLERDHPVVAQRVREYKFSPTRAWRFDFAWPGVLVALEVDGGVHTTYVNERTGRRVVGGRHNQDDDREKLNAACAYGWRVLRVSPTMLRKAERGDASWPAALVAALKWRRGSDIVEVRDQRLLW